MNKWPIVKLDDVCTFMTGGTPTSSNKAYYEGGDIPWLVSGDIHKGDIFDCDARITAKGMENSNAKLLPEGSVLIALNGQGKTRGTVALLRMPRATCNQSLVSINPTSRERLLPEFLFYQLRGMYSQIRGITGDNERSGLSISIIKTIHIALPTLAVQERIVKLLDEADGLRRLRTQADQRSTALIPALFHEMFGSTGGWPVEQLENLCKRVTVGHVGPMATEYVENGVTFLRGQNIKRGRLDLSSVLFVSHDFHKRLQKSAIVPGDVVSVRTGKPGTTAVIPPSLKVANCADLIVMTCGDKLNPHFLCELLNQRLGDKDNIAGATGIAQQHFNIGEARRLNIALPPLALQKEFAQRVTNIRDLEASQATSRTHLDALFQSMLHRAFNGEL